MKILNDSKGNNVVDDDDHEADIGYFSSIICTRIVTGVCEVCS